MYHLNYSFRTGKNNKNKKIEHNPDAKTETPTYDILIGAFLKEVIIWTVAMLILYSFH